MLFPNDFKGPMRIVEARPLHFEHFTIETQLEHPRLAVRIALRFALFVAACGLSACVQGQRAADTGDPGFPFGPTAFFLPLILIDTHRAIENHVDRRPLP